MTSPQDGHLGKDTILPEQPIACPICGNQYMPPKRGLHNWKKLFRKPRLDDWLTLFIIIMVLFAWQAYKHDIATCRDFIKNQTNVQFNPTVMGQDIQIPEINYTGLFENESES